MPILYSVIARGSTVLAKHSSGNENFDDVVSEVLKNKPQEDTKHSYKFIENVINCVVENNILYICITNLDYNQELSFHFLESLKNKFKKKYGNLIQTALPFSMNSEFKKIMAIYMSHYNQDNLKLADLEAKINDLTDVMKSNLKKAIQRSDNIEDLAQQSEHMVENSVEFSRITGRVKRRFWWKEFKTKVIIGVGVTIICAIIIGLIVWEFKK